MALPPTAPIELVLQNATGAPELIVVDSEENPINVTNVIVTLLDSSGKTIVTDNFQDAGTRINNPETGKYTFELGNVSPNNETNQVRDLLIQWWIQSPGGAANVVATQIIKVVSVCALQMAHYLRNMIDKSAKSVNADPLDFCSLGYTDANLIQYLEQGLSLINAYQPYPTFCTLEQFPMKKFMHILLESSMVAGVMAQQLFAIDEDIPNYSDQGNSFVIQHAPQLSQFLQMISARLDKLIPQMKHHFVNSGGLHIQGGTNFRIATLLNAAPGGVTIRNLFTS